VTYVVGLRPPSAVQVDDVRRVYASAFGPPPYGERATEVAAGVARFLDHAQKEGFRLATAWLDDGLVGFSYGNLCGPDGAFARFAIRDLGPERAACWVSGRFFELVELAVDPPHHGHGLGRRLHDLVLAEIDAPHAMLATHRDAAAARRLYASAGWCELNAPADGREPLVVMSRLRP
jgi:GNAT superfamily N-acetyltransferase